MGNICNIVKLLFMIWLAVNGALYYYHSKTKMYGEWFFGAWYEVRSDARRRARRRVATDSRWINSFSQQKTTDFPTIDFYHFFSMKMSEFWKMILVSCIIDFDDIQLWLRQFCLNLNICKVMTVFLIFLGQNLKKIVIPLQILRFKQNCPWQSWISSK